MGREILIRVGAGMLLAVFLAGGAIASSGLLPLLGLKEGGAVDDQSFLLVVGGLYAVVLWGAFYAFLIQFLRLGNRAYTPRHAWAGFLCLYVSVPFAEAALLYTLGGNLLSGSACLVAGVGLLCLFFLCIRRKRG